MLIHVMRPAQREPDPPSCHTRATSQRQSRSTEVTPDHDQPQVKAWTRTSFEGSQALIKQKCLRQTSAPGWIRHRGPDGGESFRGTSIPSRRRQRHSRPGASGPGRSSRAVLHLAHWPRPASKQARRRDGIPTPGRRPAASQHPACNRSGPRVPPTCP
jgi:hypothetical protein